MDIPYKYRFLIYILLLGLILLVAGLLVFAQRIAPTGKEGDKTTDLIVIQENSLVGTRIPYFPEFQVLGVEIDETLYEIIKCESGFRPDVCSYAGCGSGQGLAQLIPSTVKYCEQKLGKTIDPFDPAQNLECAIWLYENEGIKHWEQSKQCWL